MTRLLALIPGGIGDQMLCFPMLESLQHQYPQAQIDVVVEPQSKDAYRVSQVVKQVLTYSFSGRTGPADWGNLIGWVREREYDALISLDKSYFGGLLLWLTGVPTRVGFAGQPGSIFLTDTVPLKADRYAAHRYHDLLGGLHVRRNCPPLSINVPRKDIEWAEVEQKRLGIDLSQGYIAIHGGSAVDRDTKGPDSIYPGPSWRSLVKGLQDRQPDLPVVLVHAPQDRDWFRAVLEGLPGLKVSTPEDLGKFAAMVASAQLMVCTDSDAMHLAVAVGTYLFALFGPTNPALVLPEDKRVTVMRSPTGKVADIAPIQVLEKIWSQ
ncbi:glycosyltransferase family 9 protein [Altericista sp. CCNU0014]|uniref:glycosyltransferase family 9 protein n=1 Tax=Altericista sp. CCNU0014 TaxID=3082949 RepID=UPI00384C7DA4